MRKCHHHYQWYNGKLQCARCGHRKWLTHGATRKIGKACVCAVLVVIGFFVYENIGMLNQKAHNEIVIIQQSEYTKPILNKIKSLSTAVESQPLLSIATRQYTVEELRQVALNDLNGYRKQNGVANLTLGNARTPQLYAEELLKEHCIHHIDSQGQGPMLRYKTNGDIMYLVGENVAGGGIDGTPDGQITAHDWAMMYNDAGSNWGHKQNILNPSYQSVSLGIAFDSSNLVMVQDFQEVLQSGYLYDPSSFQTEPLDNKFCW